MNRMLLVATIAALAPATLSAQTQAATTASITDGVIYACYVPKTGTVYRINVSGSPTKCAANHVSFSWNITGPEGPEGPPAPSGVAGHRIVTDHKSVNPQTSDFIVVQCAADEVVLGGGYDASDQATSDPFKNLTVPINAPLLKYPDISPGWATRVFNTDPSLTLALTVYAVCAKATN
jgi:hypothetical protein